MPANCPSCTRFIGPLDICPYCHDRRLLAPALRQARRTVIPAAVLLLSAMTLFAARRPLPVITGRDVTPLMNHARVTLEGTIRYKPQIRSTPVDSIYIPILSGERLIRVRAYKEAARSQAVQSVGLKRGDHILATGSLSLSHHRDPVLYVDRIEKVK